MRNNQDMDIPGFKSEPVGVFLSMIGLSYQYLSAKNERGELKFPNFEILEHDAAIISEQHNIMSDEEIREFLTDLDLGHNYYSSESARFGKLLNNLENDENKLLNQHVKEKMEEFLSKSRRLKGFLAASFWVYPDTGQDPNNFRLCMFPDKNCDRAGGGTNEEDIFYSKKSDKLNKLVDDVRDSLGEYTAKSEYGIKAIRS